jgi:hypothetical protein
LRVEKKKTWPKLQRCWSLQNAECKNNMKNNKFTQLHNYLFNHCGNI